MAGEQDRIEALSRTFRRFGTVEATAQGSPIYERLSEVVAADGTLLSIAAEAQSGQPAPNLFFGAVHAVLLSDPDHPLARYYPSTGGVRPIDEALDGVFRDYVLSHRDAIVALLRSRLVQTNEVRRSAGLLPAFATVSTDAGGAPLALFEVGPSAGLNLLLDRYRYDYSGRAAGDLASSLRLETELRGPVLPPLDMPRVTTRWGVDLNALDVRSMEDMDWLRALLWPEHDGRRAVLDAAIAVAQEDPPDVVGGDLFELLPSAVRAAPREAAVVVFATFVLNQFSPDLRERFHRLLIDLAVQRPIHLVVVGYQDYFTGDIGDDGSAQIWLATLEGESATARCLGRMSPHGWWIEWDPGVSRRWE